MQKILVAVSGLPGNMATLVAKAIEDDDRFHLLALGLTGPEMNGSNSVQIGDRKILLCSPSERQTFLDYVLGIRKKGSYPKILVADFTHPDAVIKNASFYTENGLPFVMGTTGGDRVHLYQIVEGSTVSAVIASNMAAQVVALQAAIEHMATTFPDAFSGFQMEIVESHQQGKADTSGTAKALVVEFNKLGIPFDVKNIRLIREPAEQKALGIAEAYLAGHGWHKYRLFLPDGTMVFEFVHNISGRSPYVAGTLRALSFLADQPANVLHGKAFSMIDVLKAG